MACRVFAFTLLLIGMGVALAEPTTYASRRYAVELNGTTLRATQFLEYSGGYFEKCNFLLDLAEKRYPTHKTVTRNCGISLPTPDGTPPPAIPSAGDFYVAYEDSIFNGQVSKSFTIYHLSAEQLKTSSKVCQQIVGEFHSGQKNVHCHSPNTK